MKRWIVAALLPLIFAGGAASSSHRLTDEDVIGIVKASLSSNPWSKDAEYTVLRGDGNLLARWIVVVSCGTCAEDSALMPHGIAVLSLDKEGRQRCIATATAGRCEKPMTGRGGRTSREIALTLRSGSRIKVTDTGESGGGMFLQLSIVETQASSTHSTREH